MRTRTGLLRSNRARLGAALAIILMVAACGSAASAPEAASAPRAATSNDKTAADGLTPEQFGAAGVPVTGGTSGTVADSSSVVLDVSRPDLLIIKTGTLTLQVRDILASVDSANSKIVALGGYASGSSQNGDGEDLSATVTYRIPVAQWDAAIAALRGLAIKVVDAQTQTQDVTGQVVDLGARLTNLQATERALQEIMTKATKISDVLDVQSQLTTVRGEIEQATAEKQHLQEQAAYSTLTVAFGRKPQAAVAQTQQNFDPGSEIDRASAALVNILQGVATAAIWFAIVWLPVLIVVGLIALVAMIFVRRRRPARPDDPAGAPPALPMDIPAPPVEG